MRKAALLAVLTGLFVSGMAEARWGHPYRGAGVYIGPLHAGFYAYHLAAIPPPPVFYYAPPVAYYAPPAVYIPAPVYYVAPPPVVAAYTPPPAYAPPAAPTYYAPAAVPPPPAELVTAPVAPQEPDRIPRVAVKWAPLGITNLQSPPSTSGGPTNNFPINAGNVGLEYRFANKVWSLRSDFEYGLYGGAWDFLSLKMSLFRNSFLRPYLSAGVTGTNVYDHNLTTGITTKTPTAGGVAAGGLDLFIGKHFFIEAEAKARIFAIPVGGSSTTPPNATASSFSPTSQFSGMLGAGVAFF